MIATQTCKNKCGCGNDVGTGPNQGNGCLWIVLVVIALILLGYNYLV